MLHMNIDMIFQFRVIKCTCIGKRKDKKETHEIRTNDLKDKKNSPGGEVSLS